jgi:hypothetical protein
VAELVSLHAPTRPPGRNVSRLRPPPFVRPNPVVVASAERSLLGLCILVSHYIPLSLAELEHLKVGLVELGKSYLSPRPDSMLLNEVSVPPHRYWFQLCLVPRRLTAYNYPTAMHGLMRARSPTGVRLRKPPRNS